MRRANFSQKRNVRTNFSYSTVLTNDGLVLLVNLKFESFVYRKKLSTIRPQKLAKNSEYIINKKGNGIGGKLNSSIKDLPRAFFMLD